jgi:alpha-glucosidase
LLKAQLAMREVVALSPRTMSAIARNSVSMSVHDLRWQRTHPRVSDVDAGALTGSSKIDTTSIACTFERATLHVRALEPGLVRLSWGPGRAPFDVATRDAQFAPVPNIEIEIAPDGAASLRTDVVEVTVTNDGVTVCDTTGSVRYRELTPLSAGSHRVLRRVLRDGERLCGLGEQAGTLDLSGGTFRMWNRDPGGSWSTGENPLYCSIPITVGLHESGPVWAFHENSYEADVTIGHVRHAPHGVEADFHDGALVTYVAVGELDELLTTASHLVGAPSMPPRWALGYHHCRWGWRTDRVVQGVLDGFVMRSIPISALHLDIDHMDAFRVFTFDAQRFGGVEALAANASRSGVRIVAIVDPAVRRDPGFPLYQDGIEGGHFVRRNDGEVEFGTVWPGWAAFPDFTSSATRAWWTSQYAALTAIGIAGIWHDMNEPTSITLWGDRTLPRDAVHDFDGRKGRHAEAHNLYGLLMDKAGHAAMQREDRRAFVLSRSGWAGVARYAWHWTADVESSIEGLRQQVPTFLGLGLSSVPFTGSDLGGFTGIPSPELYLRWLELGVVSPFCRTHCVLGAPDREPWRFPAPFDTAIERLIRLRYRLLPHLYRLAEEAHRLGHPLVRPLDWPVDGTPSGHGADASAFLLGNELLVVPVADPGAAAVIAQVPRGRWRRLRLCAPLEGALGDEEVVEGPAARTFDAPIGQPVVLQREGSIVVLDDGWREDGQTLDASHSAAVWSLHVTLDASGEARGDGFDDAGDGTGPSRSDRYVATTSRDTLVIEWSSHGDFPRVGPVLVVVHGAAYSAGRVSGGPIPVELADGSTLVRLDGPFDRLELDRLSDDRDGRSDDVAGGT